MIKICYEIFDKSSGNEVKRGLELFSNLDSFFGYMADKYGYTSRCYRFNYCYSQLSTA